MTSPTVSIVLITFNDVARLPRALDSALAQTLHDLEVIVVDDCSSDGTEAFVRERMTSDARLRYLRLPVNSGGCSAPRNAGIEQAHGTWVMFCDSDDELERHAAKNLLIAAEQADADLACGVVERVEVGSGSRARWRAEVHEPATLTGIGERPELIADTVSVNKLYRRSWLLDRGITFPDGLLYEDQLFTMQCYAEAARIAVIDRTVYSWSVERAAEDLSITQRRHDLRNVRDRIEVNRLIDRYLGANGRDDLMAVKTAKFLRHDLYLHLVPLLELPDEQARDVMGVLRPYVQGLDLRSAGELRPALRIATYHLLVDDLDGVRRALRTLRWSSVLPVRIEQRAGRDVWACAHLATGPDVGGFPVTWWLDVDELRCSRAQLTDQRWCHEAELLTLHGDGVTVRGETVDAYGRLGEVTDVRLVLTDGPRIVHSQALTWSYADGRLRWEGDGAWRSIARRAPQDRGVVQVRVEIAGRSNVMPIRALASVSEHGRQVVLTSGERGTVRWQSQPVSRYTAGAIAGRLLAGVLPSVARWLPSTGTVCVSAGGGRVFGGAPRLLSASLHRDHPEVPQVWALPDGLTEPPEYARVVYPGGWRHRLAAARAMWIIDDGQPLHTGGGAAAPGALRGGRSTRSALVIEPTLHRIGRDRRDWPLLSRRERVSPPDADLLVVPSATLRSRAAALGHVGVVSVAPPLVRRDRGRARERLDLPAASPIVLWAAVDGSVLPIEEFARTLDRDWMLLVHAPGARVPAAVRAWVRDVTNTVDVADLIAAVDVVVTDASALAAYAAAADLPIIVFTPDVRDLESRGPGLDLDLDTPPGPIATDVETLVHALGARAANDFRIAADVSEGHARLKALATGDARSTWDAMGWS